MLLPLDGAPQINKNSEWTEQEQKKNTNYEQEAETMRPWSMNKNHEQEEHETMIHEQEPRMIWYSYYN